MSVRSKRNKERHVGRHGGREKSVKKGKDGGINGEEESQTDGEGGFVRRMNSMLLPSHWR